MLIKLVISGLTLYCVIHMYMHMFTLIIIVMGGARMAFDAPYIVISLQTFLCFFCRRDAYVGFVKTDCPKRLTSRHARCHVTICQAIGHYSYTETYLIVQCILLYIVVLIVVEMNVWIVACQSLKVRMHTGSCAPTFVRAKCREKVDTKIDTLFRIAYSTWPTLLPFVWHRIEVVYRVTEARNKDLYFCIGMLTLKIILW